jgi:hypothetical protein
LRTQVRHDAVAWAVALLPFAILAIVDPRIPGFLLLYIVVVLAACLAPHAYFGVRFRNLDPAEVPLRSELPRRLLLTRAALPTASMAVALAFLFGRGRPSDGFSPPILAATGAVAFGSWSLTNWLWRRWARSLGFNPDAVLAAVYRADTTHRRDPKPPAAS